MNIVLVHPLIPQNTGNIGRLCVCTNTKLHLIEPLGFKIDEKQLRRAGMDYWQFLQVSTYANWQEFLRLEKPSRLFFLSTKGKKHLYECKFLENDYLIFGNESVGLPKNFYEDYAQDLFQIPMPGEYIRSLNLANSASIALYEALRQIKYQ